MSGPPRARKPTTTPQIPTIATERKRIIAHGMRRRREIEDGTAMTLIGPDSTSAKGLLFGAAYLYLPTDPHGVYVGSRAWLGGRLLPVQRTADRPGERVHSQRARGAH